jgi:hypothetical protein
VKGGHVVHLLFIVRLLRFEGYDQWSHSGGDQVPRAANDLIADLERIRTDRYSFSQPAHLRASTGEPLKCIIVNLSREGCRITLEGELAAGDPVVVETAGWPKLAATILWCDGLAAGLKFSVPIRTSTLAMMLKTAEGLDRLGDDIYI